MGAAVPISVGGGGDGSQSNTMSVRTKFHLDPPNRLATIHQRYRQTGQTGKRSRSIGRTVTCNGRPKTTCANHEIFCTCYLWPWLGPPLMTMQYAVYFRFCGWRHICPQWTIWRLANRANVQSDSPGGRIRGEVMISTISLLIKCILRNQGEPRNLICL